MLDFPQQLRQARDIAGICKVVFEKRDFTNIIFAGVGGSSIGADIIRSYLYFKSQLKIDIVRGYELPAYVDNQTLIFTSSYSGNTEETLGAYTQAKEKGACIIAISSGGALKELALKDKLTFIELPKGLPPRYSAGYLSIAPLIVLAKLGLVEDPTPSINEVIRVLEDLRDLSLNPGIVEKDNIAKYIASRIFNRFAAIYSGPNHFVAATRLRNQINENSKSLALSHFFPEAAHNEISGWQNPARLLKNFTVVMLRDKYEHPRISKEMDIAKEIFKRQGISVFEVFSRGEGLLARIFSLIYIGDFISFYLAILYGVDPAPVEKIDYFKKRLTEN